MTPDQAQAAAARGSSTAPQMQRRLGGAPLSNKGLLRGLFAVAPIGASAATAAAEAIAAAEAKAAGETKAAEASLIAVRFAGRGVLRFGSPFPPT